MKTLQTKSEISPFLIRFVACVLIFTLAVPEAVNVFNSFKFLNISAAFAADNDEEETGTLPLEKINREHYFRLVEICIPKWIQKLIRKLANTAIDKVVEQLFNAIPVPLLNTILAKGWDAMKVFRKIVDLPIYPSCSCKDDDNTQDSAWIPLNWRFAQNFIKEKVEKRRKELFPKWEENQQPMLVSRDETGKGFNDTMKMDGVGNVLRSDWKDKSYFPDGEPLVKISADFDKNFNERFPEYSAFTSIIDEQQRLADNWRKIQPGVLKMMAHFHNNIVFDKLEYVWTSAMIKDVFSNRGNRQYRNSTWGWYHTDREKYRDNFDLFKDYDSEETQSAQTRALQAVAVINKSTGDIVERNAYQWGLFAEVSITAQQNKKSLKQAVRKNVDLMGHHTATKKNSGKKMKLGFN